MIRENWGRLFPVVDASGKHDAGNHRPHSKPDFFGVRLSHRERDFSRATAPNEQKRDGRRNTAETLQKLLLRHRANTAQ